MSEIKKLAGQTLWYGVSSIAARFINYLLTPYLTYNALMTTADYGRMSAIYSAVPLLNILFTYGLETAYFKFIQDKNRVEAVNNTAAISMLFSTCMLGFILWIFKDSFGTLAALPDYPLLIELSIVIIILEALTAIPFARLRNESRPKRYAFIRIIGILFNVAATLFFLSWCPNAIKQNPQHWAILIYQPGNNPVTYILIANIIQTIITLVLLSKWLLPSAWNFNKALWKEMMRYAFPMLIVGIGYVVNETFDRLMLGWWLPHENGFADEQRGIYGACYKLSILITLFIQAFRMGAEPFFFKQASTDSPQPVYARVTKFFVILVTVMFLIVQLLLPIWKNFIAPVYWSGLSVVPLLLFANIFLGIYYNLSVWYKITSHTLYGAWITLTGTAITIGINWLFIPKYGYMACAWATFLCYGTMMVISFIKGQKVYYIPYAWKKLVAYMVIVALIFFIHKGIASLWLNDVFYIITGLIFILAYCLFVMRIERKEFAKFPYIGKYFIKP